jgi:hypothetical protein
MAAVGVTFIVGTGHLLLVAPSSVVPGMARASPGAGLALDTPAGRGQSGAVHGDEQRTEQTPSPPGQPTGQVAAAEQSGQLSPGPHRTLLWHRDFMMLWSGQTVSQMGSAITLLALPLTAVVVLRASTFQVGLLSSASTAALALIALPALPCPPAPSWTGTPNGG